MSAAAGIAFEEFNAIPALSTPIDSEAVALAQALSGANAVGKVSFGTEGGLYQQAGIPTVICGPGSIEQAHRPNEFIASTRCGSARPSCASLIALLAVGGRGA